MAQVVLSDAIASHVEAVVTLSKSQILRRLLTEAELCIEASDMSTAVRLAGIALDELLTMGSLGVVHQWRQSVLAWHHLRDEAIGGGLGTYKADRTAVVEMVDGVSGMLSLLEQRSDKPQDNLPERDNPTGIVGKYAFVPTSVEGFLRRKQEDIDIES